jgi:glycosyltransferase involved in cell wall biosynthesis
MDFTIITPSFKQLDYLGCCIASVADQGAKNSENVGMCESANVRTHESKKDQISIEHIVQDAGSPGIEEFAKKMGEQLLRQYGGEQVSNLENFELLHIRTAHGYILRIFKERDSGMYDAVNKGLKKGEGKICAYLNCDEQYLVGTLQQIRRLFAIKVGTEVTFGGVAIVSPNGKLIARRKACHLSYPHVMTCHLPNFTASMFFLRELLAKRAAWFDVAYRDVADAVWVLARLKEEAKIERVSVITTAFTDTGANMNLSPNARREARELRESAPKWIKVLRPWWEFAHRARKLLEGQYWPIAMEYGLYLKGAGGRTEFKVIRASPLWWERLYQNK